ncbi:ROK family protein [Enterococcus pingfangensis]|uniref:ROK family protein n=1 Tax=Enterococcus pingfangensis TaxID=2559924 RepID=UPI0010F6DB2F|nr:ROK family protein [Enterococcus pingfangensis]
MLYGAIEAGGTKFVCAVGNEKFKIIERVSFPTETPEKTMSSVVDFFNKFDNVKTIGIGSFGPIDVKKDSKTYGFITSTPKLAWENFNFVGYLKEQLNNISVVWTTDVNAACYGEYIAGYGKGLSNVVYYTIGTGIGGGALLDGRFIEGFSHPEMGHATVRRHPEDTFIGNCPYHDDCLEGLAAGPAIENRTGVKGQNLPQEDSSWDIEAYYIAQCAYNTTLLFSPQIIIFGGGVMKQKHLRKKVQEQFDKLINGYVKYPDLSTYIVTPKLGDDAGITGCLALAKDSYLKA